MPRLQFMLRTLLVAMLVVGAFIAGMAFERERRRRADEARDPDYDQVRRPRTHNIEIFNTTEAGRAKQ